jgi:hypothetical protein
MEIVVNHLTRMAAPRICVAGVVVGGRRHVRPIVPGSRLDANDLAERGGLFSLGAVVRFAKVVPRPSPPEVEDVAFAPQTAIGVRRVSGDELWALMTDVAESELRSIFGGELDRDGRTASLPEGVGDASLGVMRPRGRLLLEIEYAKPRLRFLDPELGSLNAPVTDLRLVEPETGALDRDRVALVQDRLRRRECLLSIGVGHVWAREEGRPRHWLQINNIHLDDNPLWPD